MYANKSRRKYERDIQQLSNPGIPMGIDPAPFQADLFLYFLSLNMSDWDPKSLQVSWYSYIHGICMIYA